MGFIDKLNIIKNVAVESTKRWYKKLRKVTKKQR